MAFDIGNILEQGLTTAGQIFLIQEQRESTIAATTLARTQAELLTAQTTLQQRMQATQFSALFSTTNLLIGAAVLAAGILILPKLKKI